MYKIERIIEFTQTDFPAPVAPAIRRCGVFTRSSSCAFPRMSFPKITGIAILLYSGKSCSIISRKLTIERCLFGTSIPTAARPGIGATIRTELAARLSAILSCSVTILLSFTPGAGASSNIVTTGPFFMPIISASILNWLRVSLSLRESAFVCSSIIQYWSFSYSSRSDVGILYGPFALARLEGAEFCAERESEILFSGISWLSKSDCCSGSVKVNFFPFNSSRISFSISSKTSTESDVSGVSNGFTSSTRSSVS